MLENVTTLRKKIKSYCLRHFLLAFFLLAFIISTVYWSLIASDMYVSETHIIVERTDLPSGQDFGVVGGFISGVLGAGGGSDQLMLQDYLKSVDLLQRLDGKLKLRQHYSDQKNDPVSRMWRQETEWFHRYFFNQVEIIHDKDHGFLRIRVKAYDPVMAQKIASLLVEEGERFMNDTAHDLANGQVKFLENQLVEMKENVIDSRRVLLAYQNKHKMISPQATVEGLGTTVEVLTGKRIEVETQINAMRAYLVANHPSITQLEQQLGALNEQINKERDKLVANNGTPLNAKVEEYQRLQFEAGFAEEVYKTALAAFERGRIEALRTIKKVVVLQKPNYPEYPWEPRRFYNSLVSGLLLLLVYGVSQLILAIINEHKD